MASYMRSFNFLYNTNTGEVEINPNYFENGPGVITQHNTNQALPLHPPQPIPHPHPLAHPPTTVENQSYMLQELDPQPHLMKSAPVPNLPPSIPPPAVVPTTTASAPSQPTTGKAKVTKDRSTLS